MELVSMVFKDASGKSVSVDVPQLREGDVMDLMSNFSPTAASIILNEYLKTLSLHAVVLHPEKENTTTLYQHYVTKALNSVFDDLDDDATVN